MISIVDSHHHCWQYDSVAYSWINERMQVIQRDFLPEHLLPLLKNNGVSGTVLVQSHQSVEDNQFMLSLAKSNQFIRGLVGWIDLQAPDLSEQLACWKEEPLMKGFRHIAQAEPNDFLARHEVIKGISELGKAGFTYDILIKPPQMEAALKLVRALPHQPFVIDHMAKPYIAAGEIDEWAKNIKELAAFPNVHCKISGMVTEADWHSWTYGQLEPYMDTVLDAFGPKRLMFGSDWPVCLVAASYSQWVQVVERFVGKLSVTEQEAIWHGNATRFYNL